MSAKGHDGVMPLERCASFWIIKSLFYPKLYSIQKAAKRSQFYPHVTMACWGQPSAVHRRGTEAAAPGVRLRKRQQQKPKKNQFATPELVQSSARRHRVGRSTSSALWGGADTQWTQYSVGLSAQGSAAAVITPPLSPKYRNGWPPISNRGMFSARQLNQE
jgi:hypothetical protein